jgi:WhiB family transcriptional regulator, redox-sensing transcriptional regulator
MNKPQRLPMPIVESYEWQDRGLCRRMPVEVFFEADGARGANKRRREEVAKRVCARCPVLEPCRVHALAAEDFGVWGGLSANEREEMRRASGRTATRAS